jgi:hypothetical protein
VRDFFANQRTIWKEKGGELISLPAEEQTALLEKVSGVGFDLSKSKPELSDAVKTVFESARRNK